MSMKHSAALRNVRLDKIAPFPYLFISFHMHNSITLLSPVLMIISGLKTDRYLLVLFSCY